MKKFIHKIVDAPKLIKRIWILLWVILVILLVMKFCFGIWYPIVVENKTFIKICSFIDYNRILSLIIMGIFYFLSANIICLTFMNNKFYHNFWIGSLFNVIIIGTYIIKIYNNTIGNIIEIFYSVGLPIIFNLKTDAYKNKGNNIIFPIILFIILNVWQFSIYLVRGLEINQLDKYPSLIYITLMMDYYVFLIITWIGVCHMGLLSIGWLFSKDITVLKAEKEKELAKKAPDMSKIAKIDARIEMLEKEGK